VLLKSRSHRAGFTYHALSKIGRAHPNERCICQTRLARLAERYGRHWGLVMMQPVLYPMQ
jgi:hypothetical protein